MCRLVRAKMMCSLACPTHVPSRQRVFHSCHSGQESRVVVNGQTGTMSDENPTRGVHVLVAVVAMLALPATIWWLFTR